MIPGLLKALRSLAESSSITTIVPGRLYKTSKLPCSSAASLQLKLTTSSSSAAAQAHADAPAKIISQKVIVRRESLAQEVFLSFDEKTAFCSQSELARHITQLLRKDDSVTVIVQGENKQTMTMMEKAIGTKINWK